MPDRGESIAEKLNASLVLWILANKTTPNYKKNMMINASIEDNQRGNTINPNALSGVFSPRNIWTGSPRINRGMRMFTIRSGQDVHLSDPYPLKRQMNL